MFLLGYTDMEYWEHFKRTNIYNIVTSTLKDVQKIVTLNEQYWSTILVYQQDTT